MFDIENMKFITCCFVGIVSTAIVWQYLYPSYDNFISYVDPEYDFIIVGAGTAGCVLASRLSEIPNAKVLLIEAGDDISFISEIPMLPTMLQKGSNDWAFETVSQTHSSYGLNDEVQFLPRGKGLGGTGKLNYLLHGLGIPSDFDIWAQMGSFGWSYKDLKPYFNRIFKLNYNSSRYSTSKRVIQLSSIDDKLQDITQTFIQASKELPVNIPLNVTSIKNTVYNGKRESTYKSYLVPALGRKNLHIMKNALVTKLNFKGKNAVTIEILKNKIIQQTSIKSEVILSAGSLHTPQILTLSGIGAKSELDRLDIQPVAFSEGVGMNLHDHLNMPLYVSIEKPMTITVKKVMSFETLYSYLMKGKGYLSSPGVVAIGRGKDKTGTLLFAVGSVDEVFFCHVSNMKTEVFRRAFPFYNNSSREGFIFMNSCLQPISRGHVRLKSKEPTVLPLVDPNYLSDKKDVECTITALKTVIEIIKTPTFQNIGATIHWPYLTKCKHLWDIDGKVSDEYLECIIRSNALTGHHPAGTCSMAGKDSVVDHNLLVKGVNKVRIVDASIFPTPISSPPNSVIIAISEKASEMILRKHNNKL